MSEAGQGALEQALAGMATPALLPGLRSAALPADVLLVLKLAAGDEDSLAAESGRLGLSATKLHEVAVFYIQQVLFAQGADSYRVLGARADIPAARLREHYRWLVRWLHPDRNRNDWEDVYLERVHRAWQQLRTPERRHVHDMAALTTRPTEAGTHAAAPSPRGPVASSPRRRRARQAGNRGAALLILMLCGFAALLALLWHRDPGLQEEAGIAVDLAMTPPEPARPDGSRMALLPQASAEQASGDRQDADAGGGGLQAIEAGIEQGPLAIAARVQAPIADTDIVATPGLPAGPASLATRPPVVVATAPPRAMAKVIVPAGTPAAVVAAMPAPRMAEQAAPTPRADGVRRTIAPSFSVASKATPTRAEENPRPGIEQAKVAKAAPVDRLADSSAPEATVVPPALVAKPPVPAAARPVSTQALPAGNNPAAAAGKATMNDRVAFALAQKFRRAYNEGDVAALGELFVAGGNRQQVADALRGQLQSGERAKLSFGRLDWRLEGERVLVEAGYRVQRGGSLPSGSGQARFELREEAGAFRILRLQPEAF